MEGLRIVNKKVTPAVFGATVEKAMLSRVSEPNTSISQPRDDHVVISSESGKELVAIRRRAAGVFGVSVNDSHEDVEGLERAVVAAAREVGVIAYAED
jgi:hypothetical protein